MYLFIKRRKDALSFALYGIFIGGISIVVTAIMFPTYFTVNIYLLAIYNDYQLLRSILRFIKLGFYYFPLYITVLWAIVSRIIVSTKEKNIKNLFLLLQHLKL